MKQKLLLGILSACALLNVGCGEIEDDLHHYYIDVYNQSNTPISAAYTFHYLEDSICLPAGEHRRLVASEGWFCGFGSGLYIWENCLGHDSLAVNIYDDRADSLLLTYLLTRDNLRELGWCIAYPPSAEMSNITIRKPEEQ